MAGAKKKLEEYFRSHVGEVIPNDRLYEISGNVKNYTRSIRQLRQEKGWDLSYLRSENAYILRSLDAVNRLNIRKAISKKLRFEVLERDDYTCQGCGKTIKEDKIKLSIDHVVPVKWGGETTLENLQALCRTCNEGKQAWITGESKSVMSEVSRQTNTENRLRVYFENYRNVEIPVDRLAVVAKTREWTRQIRYLREHTGMQIEARRKNSKLGREVDMYIFLDDTQSK